MGCLHCCADCLLACRVPCAVEFMTEVEPSFTLLIAAVRITLQLTLTSFSDLHERKHSKRHTMDLVMVIT